MIGLHDAMQTSAFHPPAVQNSPPGYCRPRNNPGRGLGRIAETPAEICARGVHKTMQTVSTLLWTPRPGVIGVCVELRTPCAFVTKAQSVGIGLSNTMTETLPQTFCDHRRIQTSPAPGEGEVMKPDIG